MRTTIEVADTWRVKRGDMVSPQFAMASTLLNPDKIDPAVYGHFVAMVFSRGTRIYMFDGQANRDRFVNAHRHFSARPCKDPVK